MTRPVLLHEGAEAELNEAADFYDLECSGLGTAFLDEVEAAIADIGRFPSASPIIQMGIRMKPLRKFPYSLMYSVSRNTITVFAIAHQSRRPFYWHGR